jgi:ATP-binding cassette subfamily B protein
VTHRLAEIQRADCILVLEEGRIVESGSPENLGAAGGPFQGLAGRRLGSAAP